MYILYIYIFIDQQPGGNPALDGTRDVDQLDIWWEGETVETVARRGLRSALLRRNS